MSKEFRNFGHENNGENPDHYGNKLSSIDQINNMRLEQNKSTKTGAGGNNRSNYQNSASKHNDLLEFFQKQFTRFKTKLKLPTRAYDLSM